MARATDCPCRKGRQAQLDKVVSSSPLEMLTLDVSERGKRGAVEELTGTAVAIRQPVERAGGPVTSLAAETVASDGRHDGESWMGKIDVVVL